MCQGDHEIASILLGAGANPNQPNEDNVTPLLIAVRQSDHETTRALLGAGANPNQPNEDNVNPLLIAVHRGDHEIARALLAAGANLTKEPSPEKSNDAPPAKRIRR